MYTVAAINIALEAFAGVILAIIMTGMLLDKNRRLPLNRLFIRILLCYIIVLGLDVFSWAFNGNPAPKLYYALLVSNFCVYAFSALGAAVYHQYIIAYISTKADIPKSSVYIFYVICLVQLILLIVSLFNHMFYYIDETNNYCRGNLFYVAYILPIIISVVQTVIILLYRKKLRAGDTLALLSYNILLLTAVILQLSLNLIMLLYILVSIGLFIVYIRIQVEQAKRLETELVDSRVDIMLSQIQPHFIYNTLATIEAFCNKDNGKAAAKMVRDFSSYLRENMASLTQKQLVSFNREMEHIKVYLDIEKQRLWERLTVVYDLEVTDFKLPILTVQPLVENAVRYGISKKRYGGTITIITRHVPEGVKIIVSDDGAGFDCATLKEQDERSHVGIENVRERLRAQCSGTLKIESEKEKGTTCTIIIP